MSIERISKVVLLTGLTKHADKFIYPDANELPAESPEAHYYILEAALQKGFEMIDDDGDVYVCSSRQIVALVESYKTEIDRLRADLQKLSQPARQRVVTPRCTCCGTRKNLHRDYGSSGPFRCDSPDCEVL